MMSFSAKVPDGIILHLSHDEAQALADVLHHVGGHPAHTRRHYINKIITSMHSSGVEAATQVRDVEGTVSFIAR